MSGLLDRVIAWGLVAVIVFTALTHGATEPWSRTAAAIALVLLVELWAVKIFFERRLRVALPAAFWPLIGLALFAVAQGVAWAGEGGRRESLSLDVEATRATALWLILLAAAFLLGANFWTGRRRLRHLAWFLTIYGFALAVFALIQKFTWNGKFYWLRPIIEITPAFGTFVNHNLYSGYMELLIPIPVGMVMMRVVGGPARLFCLFAAAMMSISVVISLSRGGMISVAASLIFIAVAGARLALRRAREWDEDEWEEQPEEEREYLAGEPRQGFSWLPQVATVGAIGAVIVIGVMWLGPDTVASRLTSGELFSSESEIGGRSFYGNRGWIWRDTWRMFADNPWTGVGLGAYETAFPRYTETDGTYAVAQAHNDYLQILADGGITGGALALIFIALVFRAMGRVVARGDGRGEIWGTAVALGGGAALFGLLVHSVFDFNLQIPSTALLFLVMAGIIARLGETELPKSPLKGAKQG